MAQKKTHTIFGLMQETGYSYGSISNFRTGYHTASGVEVAPILREGTDWNWNGGAIEYYDSALKIIKARRALRQREGKVVTK